MIISIGNYLCCCIAIIIMPAMLCRYLVQHPMLVATETSTQMHIATARSKQPVQYRLSLLEFQSVELNVSISELCKLAIITTVTSHQFWPTGCHGIIITPHRQSLGQVAGQAWPAGWWTHASKDRKIPSSKKLQEAACVSIIIIHVILLLYYSYGEIPVTRSLGCFLL